MKDKLNSHKVGLLLGIFMALMHALWSLLVALGLAQFYLDWIYGLHFLNNPFTVYSFNPVTAVILIVFTFIVGYLAGFIFTILWNSTKRK